MTDARSKNDLSRGHSRNADVKRWNEPTHRQILPSKESRRTRRNNVASDFCFDARESAERGIILVTDGENERGLEGTYHKMKRRPI